MYLRNLFAFWRYYWKATTIYHVQSPFAFDVANIVLRDRRWYYAFDYLATKFRNFDHDFGRQLFRLMLLLQPKQYFFITQNEAVVEYHTAAHAAKTLIQKSLQAFNSEIAKPSLGHLYLDLGSEKLAQWSLPLAETAVVIVRYPHLQSENWQFLQGEPSISLTMDFYTFGLAFKRPDLSQKQHFVLIDWKKKPWLIGLFV